MAAGGMPRYTQGRMKEIESFEDRVLVPLARMDYIIAEAEQEWMRAATPPEKWLVVIRLAQWIIRATRNHHMDVFRYPYKRR